MKGRRKMKEIIIFGRGNYWEKKKECLLNDSKVIAFIDNNVVQKVWDERNKSYVYNPAVIMNLPHVEIFCMSVDYVDMAIQLLKLGVEPERISLGNMCEPYFNWGEKLISENSKLIITSSGILCEYNGEQFKIQDKNDLCNILRRITNDIYVDADLISKCNNKPINNRFGRDLGKPVDRVYIERFLEKNADSILGTVMEIESDDYIKKFGGKKVNKKIILHVKGWGGPNVIKGNFETGEGLENNMVDCLICTQTLQYIYNLSEAARNIYKIIKPNGIALITVPGIKSLSTYHDSLWGEYWSFTKKSLFRMFADVFGEKNVEVNSYGNVKTTMAYLYGLSAEMLSEQDFEYNDTNVPFIITAKVKKCQQN